MPNDQKPTFISKLFSATSPKRRKQRFGGVVLIIFMIMSGTSGAANAEEGRLVFYISMLIFCLIGLCFIYLSTKPDAQWEAEQEEQRAADDDFETEEEEEEEESEPSDRISKYLE